MGGENIKHYCGIFGVFGFPGAAKLTHLGLFALQHRGEEAAGITVSDGVKLCTYKGRGLVGDVFDDIRLEKLCGSAAIGHTRYSTTGSSVIANAQPYQAMTSRGGIAVAHNGNLINAKTLRRELEGHGSIFGSTMDSEIFVHLIAKPSYQDMEDAIIQSVRRTEGAYSLAILTEDKLFGVRDPLGFRPLCLGKIGRAHVLASETCAFDLIGAHFVREVEPGEVLVIDQNGLRSHFPSGDRGRAKAHCIFEHVYFARPDSTIFGDNVGLAREKFGRVLAREHPVKADIVVPVPDSGNFAAMGYAKESGIPLAHGFTRNHYIGRTFIQPSEESRAFKVRIKLNPIRKVVEGRRVIVVDDSIVRGNTSKSRVKLLRAAGAREVHMRISCPPHVSPCYYGIDFPSKEELLASSNSMARIKEFLDVDSIGYLSLKGMLASVSQDSKDYCTACFSGQYPTEVPDEAGKLKLEHR